MHLRYLDLSSNERLVELPKSITKLVNLQTLVLSDCCKLKELPKDVSKLSNLQTLDLRGCRSLKELPKDVSKLVNLSTLNLFYCSGLSHMPANMDKLTNLHTLRRFVVGQQCFDGLKDLVPLNNLKGNLSIIIKVSKNAKFVKESYGGGSYLRGKEYLKSIDYRFEKGDQCGSSLYDRDFLEEMQPHPNLRELLLYKYAGVSLPRWPRGDNSELFDLPNLVCLGIVNCPELQCLPLQVGKLPHLTELRLLNLPNLEYVVNANPEEIASKEVSSFFPCLESLTLRNLFKLKGWWPRSPCGMQNDNLIWVSSPCLAQLNQLSITDCPRMAFIPLCPCLEDLLVDDTSRNLRLDYMSHSPRDYQSLLQLTLKPRFLEISDLGWLNSMPTKYFQSLAMIVIKHEKKVENLAEVRELFQACLLTSLRSVQIDKSPALRSVSGWLMHLSNLETLRIDDCPDLLSGNLWQHLPQSLQCLELRSFAALEELPEQMLYCTSLQSLVIWDCPMLNHLPKWLPKLTCLEKLQLRDCSPGLEKRCQKPIGEDWPLIQQIPLICIGSPVSDDDMWARAFDKTYY